MSRVAALGTVVAIAIVALASLVFVTGDDATQRLALLFALLGVMVPGVLAMLKADEASHKVDANTTLTQTTANTVETVEKKVDGHLTDITTALRDAATNGDSALGSKG